MAALELLLVAPVMALVVLLVLWAGETGRARLVVSLAAEEAAVAAAVVCAADPAAGVTAHQQDACEEAVAADVVSARPALEQLCVAGPSPAPDPNPATPRSADGFVARHGSVLTVGVSCAAHTTAAALTAVAATVEVQAHAVHTAPATP